MLGNTYHLMLRPGAERIAALGGLHRFMRLAAADPDRFRRLPGDVAVARCARSTKQGVTFRSHIDGAMVELTPERAIEVQILLGSDIAMQLDECVRLPAERAEIARAMQLSLRWAERCKRAFEAAARRPAALFGIVQGGDDRELRAESARALVEIGFARLRHRRPRGRRAAGGDARGGRGEIAPVLPADGRAI